MNERRTADWKGVAEKQSDLIESGKKGIAELESELAAIKGAASSRASKDAIVDRATKHAESHLRHGSSRVCLQPFRQTVESRWRNRVRFRIRGHSTVGRYNPAIPQRGARPIDGVATVSGKTAVLWRK